jgi:hypothetical protein
MTCNRLILTIALVLGMGGAAAACVSDVPIDNDRTASRLTPDAGSDDDDSASDDDDDDESTTPVKDAGASAVKDSGKAAAKDAGSSNPTTGEDASTGGEGVVPTDPTTPTDPTMPTDPTTPTDPTEPTEPMMSVVAGSAPKNKCAANSKASGTMCGGYYCGVTQAQIEAEMPADTLCGASASEGACNNKLPQKVGDCSVEAISANPLVAINMDFDSIRPAVRTCVNKDAELKEKTPSVCLDCFLDAAVCAGKNCLDKCISDANDKGCLDCRTKFKCDTAVFDCAKLISPL